MSLFIRRTALLVAIVSSFSALASVALAGLAQDVFVDINGANAPENFSGTYSGPAPGGSGSWNGLTILDHGSGAGVNGTWTSQSNGLEVPTVPFIYADGHNDNTLSITTAGFVSAAENSSGPNALLNDFLVQSGTGTLTVNGLTGNLYNVFVYGTNDGSNVGGTFTVNGSDPQGTTGAPYSTAPFVLGRDYVEFTNVHVSGGVLTITAADGGSVGGVGVLDGFQLVSVPEPSTFGLLACALVAAAGMRRRLLKSRRQTHAS